MSDRGFTLIETLVAAVVFAIAAAGIGALMSTSFAMSDWNKDRANAMSIAQSEMEDVRVVRYEEVENRMGMRTIGGRTFGILRTVNRDRPAPNMAEVTVGVTWSGRRGTQQTFTAKTIVTAVRQ